VQVALKKIENVGKSLENARKVLREVCILRRLHHPHIVCLHDVFWRPSPTGEAAQHAHTQRSATCRGQASNRCSFTVPTLLRTWFCSQCEGLQIGNTD
jgi:serine/threonine protein kinase